MKLGAQVEDMSDSIYPQATIPAVDGSFKDASVEIGQIRKNTVTAVASLPRNARTASKGICSPSCPLTKTSGDVGRWCDGKQM